MTADPTGMPLAPAPGAASLHRMVLSQAGLEVRMVLRNGEQLLLTIVIPLLVLGAFAGVEVMDLGTRGERSTSSPRGCSRWP